MKNFIRILFLISFISIDIITAQVADDTPVMQYWAGGYGKIKLNMDVNITGAGAGSGIFGGVYSPSLRNGASSLFMNPAGMTNIESSQLYFDMKVGFSNNVFGVGKDDLVSPETIQEETDTFLDDSDAFIVEEGTPKTYTSFSEVEFAQLGGFSSFGIAFPLHERVKLGIGYLSLMDISFDLIMNGINTGLKATKTVGSNDTDIDIILSNNIISEFRLKMHQFSFGASFEIINKNNSMLSVGFTASNYYLKNRIYLDSYNEGMIVLNNSSEYYFNDPNDPNLSRDLGETNKMYFKSNANFMDNKWAMKFGAYYKPQETGSFLSNFRFSLVMDFMPSFKIHDNNAYAESYQPKFLTGTPLGEDEEALDIIIDSLDLAKPNLTLQTDNVFADSLLVEYPSTMLIGIDASLGKHVLAFNLVKYFGEYSFKFADYYVGYKPSFGMRMGFDLHMPDKLEGWGWVFVPVRLLFLDFDGLLMQALHKHTGYKNPHYRIGASLMFGSGIAEGLEDSEDLKNSLDTPLPRGFSLGRQYTILESLTIGTMVFGYPDLALRFSVGYRF